MDCRFTEEQVLLRDSVQKLMAKHCPPAVMRRIDHEKRYPYELYDAWVEAGLIAMPFAEAYGGLGGGAVDSCIIMEEIARVSADLSMMIGGSTFCGLNVQRKGSEEQKRHWLPKLLKGEIKMSISMSEPDAGSDVGAIRTIAVRDGDHYRDQRPEALGDRRRRQGQRHQYVCAYRPEGALPPGAVAVPDRQRHARAGAAQARHARPLLHRHLRDFPQRRARAGGSPDRRREQGLGLHPLRACRPSASSRRRRIAARRSAASRWRSPMPRSASNSAGRSAPSRRSRICSPT